MEEPNGHTVRVSNASIDRKVDDLASQVLTLNNVLIGVPGLSKGVVTDLRDGLAKLDDRLLAMQTAMPSQINAAIDEKIKDRKIQRITGTRSWITNVASSSIAVAFGVIINLVWLHFGGGANPPVK